jgi:tetratricopeptide (TPR) repeat protein
MILRMFRRLSLVSLLLLPLSASVQGQRFAPVIIDSDLRLFVTMVAVNAAGFDVELASRYHPVRASARAAAQQLDADLVARLKAFYQSHKRSQPDDAQLSKYISLALLLSDPPEFKLSGREESMPPEARDVKDFLDLLREVYTKGKLTAAWSEVRPQYESEINRLGPVIREQLVRADSYLRVPLGGRVSGEGVLAIYVELAAPVNSVNVHSDQESYFIVLGQSTTSHMEEIRHAYLHFQLDKLVALNAGKAVNGASLLDLVRNVEGVQPGYQNSYHFMATESLIRAVELRMDRPAAARAKTLVDESYRSGLLLMPYFYEALSGFEGQDSGIREFFPGMMSALRVADEQARFTATFMKIPVSQKTTSAAEVPIPDPAPLPPNPVKELLRTGQAALAANDNAKAKAVFEQVLAQHDPEDGAALYGLALIASREGDSDLARGYFERTTRSASVDPSMKVWAYIYIGRIFDLECERARAVENYQQAVKLGNDTTNAQAVAREGLKKPYGDACQISGGQAAPAKTKMIPSLT